MKTWRDLSNDFKEMIPTAFYAFLDSQWGIAGNYWNVGGGISNEIKRRFESLSKFAGDKLLSLPIDQNYLDVLKQDEPKIRWYRYLRDNSGSFEQRMPVQQIDNNGQVQGNIYHGRINRLAEVSSNVCLECELLEESHPQKGIPDELASVGLNAAAEHWLKSIEHRRASPPDLLAASSEAIKALEGVSKFIAKLPNGTLGDCIKLFRNNHRVSFGILNCLEGLWTYSNTTQGIRHGAGQEVNINIPEIDFFLDTCASGIRMLLSINAT